MKTTIDGDKGVLREKSKKIGVDVQRHIHALPSAAASLALAAIILRALPALNHSIWPSLKEWANGMVYKGMLV